jgi:hypothetical protein
MEVILRYSYTDLWKRMEQQVACSLQSRHSFFFRIAPRLNRDTSRELLAAGFVLALTPRYVILAYHGARGLQSYQHESILQKEIIPGN